MWILREAHPSRADQRGANCFAIGRPLRGVRICGANVQECDLTSIADVGLAAGDEKFGNVFGGPGVGDQNLEPAKIVIIRILPILIIIQTPE